MSYINNSQQRGCSIPEEPRDGRVQTYCENERLKTPFCRLALNRTRTELSNPVIKWMTIFAEALAVECT